MPSSLEQSINLIWVLVAAFLVMFMQVGFAMVETGFTRAKNALHTMGMNFVIYPLGVAGFWLIPKADLDRSIPASAGPQLKAEDKQRALQRSEGDDRKPGQQVPTPPAKSSTTPGA